MVAVYCPHEVLALLLWLPPHRALASQGGAVGSLRGLSALQQARQYHQIWDA